MTHSLLKVLGLEIYAKLWSNLVPINPDLTGT